MELLKNTLHIGLERPLTLLHVTDSHIARVDERDNERKHALAGRFDSSNREQLFREQLAYAKAHCDLMVHTGDLIDFTSQANFEFARTILSEEKVFFAAGNHEFSHYLGEAYEDRAYKMNSFREMLPEGLGVPLFFHSRIVGGVNFVAIDDSYHQFEAWQITRLKKELAKGLPIILCLHVPLFERSLYEYHVERSGPGTSCYLAGCEEDDLPVDEWRAIEIRPRGATMEAIDFIKSQPLIKAVLAGHIHFSFESELAPGLPQFITGGGYDGIARELSIL